MLVNNKYFNALKKSFNESEKALKEFIIEGNEVDELYSIAEGNCVD
jgi:hypothetical protein